MILKDWTLGAGLLPPWGNIHVHVYYHNSQERLANQSQTPCGSSVGKGNESLYKWSRTHDQDGRHGCN